MPRIEQLGFQPWQGIITLCCLEGSGEGRWEGRGEGGETLQWNMFKTQNHEMVLQLA